jgi:aspartate racemase
MMQKESKMIGILAGMGPKSTGPFVNQVISSFQTLTGAKDDIDFPPMIIYSLPTSFYVDRPIDHNLMKQTICGGLKKLESTGVTFIAMPCNTAHLYYEELQNCVSIPLLNIVSATLKRVPKSAKKITILGTRPTLESKVYQQGLQDNELNFIFHASWQEKIDSIISQIKKSSHISESIRSVWDELTTTLQEEEIDTVLLLCTEFNVIINILHSPFQIIDSSLCLAEEMVYKWLDH